MYRLNRARPWTWRDPILWVAATAAAGLYATLGVTRYLTHAAASWDLGIFVEAVKAYAHGRAPVVDIKGVGFNLLGDHLSPVVAVLAPAWWAWPSPAMLLVAQAVLTAASVVPVYRVAVDRLGRTQGRLVAVAYALSWGLLSMVDVSFHEVAFAVPLVAAAVASVARGRTTAAACWAAPLVAVKEDLGFTVAALGLVLAVVYRRRLLGAGLAVWGAGWSLLAVYVLIPAVNPHHRYPYWHDGVHLAKLAAGVDTKVLLLVLLALPTAAVALRSPLALVAVPSLALRLVSSNDAYWSTWWHYSATVMPILFVAAVDGLARLHRRRATYAGTRLGGWLAQHGAAMMLAVAVTLALSSPVSALWQPASYQRTARDRALDAAVELVPRGATVESSTSVLAQLAARADAYGWSDEPAEWIVYDERSYEWKVTRSFIMGRHHGYFYRLVWHRDRVWVFRQA